MGGLRRLGLVLPAFVVACVLAPTAAAVNAVTESTSAATVAPGGRVTLVATMPVAAAGTISQEIVQTIDPTKVKLTGLSDITAPEGWTLSYSTDGNTFSATTPANAAAWAAVRKVKATGSVNSQGEVAGKQLASRAATVGVPASGPFATPSSGDGGTVFFDDQGHVFNVFHHDTGSGKIDCHTRTGATCGVAWPYMNGSGIQKVSTNYRSDAVYDPVYRHIWRAGNTRYDTGFDCTDISDIERPAPCGGTVDLSFSAVGPALSPIAGTSNFGSYNTFGQVIGIAMAGGKVYTMTTINDKPYLLCVDTQANAGVGAPCPGQPYSVGGSFAAAYISEGSSTVFASQGRVYATIGGSNGVTAATVVCWDPSTNANCAGAWPQALATTSLVAMPYLFEVPDAAGRILGVCAANPRGSQIGGCFTSAGRPFTLNAGLRAWYLGVGSAFNYGNNPTTVGTKMWATNGNGAASPPRFSCWDQSLSGGQGAECPNWPKTSVLQYTVSVDPNNRNCVWTNNDAGVIKAWDTRTATENCLTPPDQVILPASVTVPRMACGPSAQGVREWRSIQLTAPGISDYASAALTIRDSAGVDIPGWTGISFGGAPRTIDLSTLPVATTGQTPTFVVDYKGLTVNTDTSVVVAALGDSPELCLDVTGTATCPASPALGALPKSVGGGATTAYGDGSASTGSGTTTMTQGSASLTVVDGADPTCGATLSGIAVTNDAYQRPIPGATVTLVNSSGTVLNWPAGYPNAGQPVTAVTDANGGYAFPPLTPGTYAALFVNEGTSTVQKARMTADSTGNATWSSFTSASGGVATSPTATITTTGPGVINGYYTTVATAVADTTSGYGAATQTATVTTNDLAQTGNTMTATSVYLCPTNAVTYTAVTCTLRPTAGAPLNVPGEGSYTLNATTGAITFTPCTTVTTNCPAGAFTGTATPIRYIAKDSGNVLVTSTYTPTVLATPSAPTGTADTSSGPAGVAQTIYPQDNDVTASGTTFTASTVKLCGASETAPSCTQTTRTVTGVGTYAVNGTTGAITFTPEAGYSGTPASMPYQVTNSLGQIANSTYTPTVIGAPAATNDTSSGAWQAAQTITPLANDTAASGANLLLTSVSLCTTATANASCTGSTLTVTGQGTYTVNAATGVVTFTPVSTFVGTATPIKYIVGDSAGSLTTATITPTVTGPAANTANPDTTSGVGGAMQSVNLLTNDTTPTGVTLTASTVRLCGVSPAETPPNCTKTTLTVTGQGSYTLSNGTVSFTPVAGYSGTATPVTYQVTDSLSRTVSSTYTPSVIGVPTATADTSTGAFNAIQTIQPQGNDAPATGTTLVATSTKICASGTAAASCTSTSLATTNGTYAVDPATGYVSFKPCSASGVAGVAPNSVSNVSCTGPFTGTATPIGYRITDALGQFATSTITPTVQAPAVDTANPDTTTGAKGAAQTINLLANDTAPAGVSLTASTVKLCGISPAQTPPNCTQTSITVTNVGTYAVVNGTMTFTPVAAYTGTPSPLTYQVTDNISRTVSSTYTPTVAAPPTVTPDTSTGSWDANQTISPLANDTAGTGTSLVASSVKLCANGTAAASCTGTTYSVTGQGTYTANADGTVTFDPVPGFSGTATPIGYRVTDALGQTSVSTITPTVSPPPAPLATPETKPVIPGGSVAFTTLTGGSGLASGTQLQTGSTFLCGVSPAQTPPNCTQTTVMVSGQGTYTLVQGTGVVTYAALGGATTGTKTPITYQVADVTGQKTSSTLTPVIPPTPTATADTSVAGAGQPQTITPLANDGAGTGTTLVATSTKICASGTPAASCTGTSLDNANGTYTVDPTTGYVTFQPCTAAATPNVNCTGPFTGTAAAIGYRVSDALGQYATSTITPTVLPQPATSATNNTGTANYAQPVVFDALANDSAGDLTIAAATYTGSVGTVALDLATVKLCSTGQSVPGCTATALNTADGTYTVNPVNGNITFQPCTAVATPNVQCAAAFTGTAPSPPTYQVCNTIAGTWLPTPAPVSTCASAAVIPTINPPAALTAAADTSSGPWNTAQTITVLTTDPGNAGSHADTTDPAATIPASSVKLCATGQVSPNCSATTVMVSGEGTYVVNVSGTVTFTPLATYQGIATPLAYQITDSLGRSASATITPTVAYPTAPTASPESMLALPGVPKAFTTITGASGLATGTQLQTSGPTQTCLIDPATLSSCSSSVTTADGTWSLNSATGVATYTADPSATPGAKTAVSYRVTDVTGQTATAALTPTVPGTPTATPDTSTGAWNTAQTRVLTTNDTAGTGTTLAVASTRLCDPNATPAEAAPNCTAASVTISGQGTYVLTGGSVVFTPLSSFFGAATPLGYQIANSAGLIASSTYTPTVQPPTSPAAAPDTSTGPWNTPQTIRPLVNDSVATGLTLSSSATYLCGPTETPPSCTQTSLNVTGEGTYVVNGDGSITFTPDAAFLGTATSVVYQTADSVGQVTYSTIAVTVTPTPPTITNATVTVPAGGSGTMQPTTTSGSSPIDPTLTCLKPSGGSACAAGDLAVTATEGTYVLNPSTGVVTFTAAPGYAGTPVNPPSMCVTNTAAATACGTLTPTVQPAATPRTDPAPPSNPNAPAGSSPIAQPDYATTQVGVPVTVALFGNDAPSIAQQLVPASVRLQDPTSGAWTTTVTVAGEGSYSVDLTTGTVTFAPIAGFTGRAKPVPYRVADTSGKVTQSTVEITVTTLPPPYANPDYAAGAQGQPLYFNLFANDQATGTTFDPSSVLLRDPKTGKWSQTVIMPGQGTYSVNPTTGVVTFMPLPSFTGTATPIDYRAATRTGTLIRSSLHPTIIGPQAKLRITTTPSRTTLRTSGSTVVRLRACNTGQATAVDTVVELPIPAGMAVPNLRQSASGPKLRNGVVRWSTGSLKPGACVSRTVTLTVLKSGTKRLVGTVRAVNATQATDPATIRGLADGTRPSVVTG
ncbi:MAG: cadherin-like domain-containing protein [Thermoleophilia bacterium]